MKKKINEILKDIEKNIKNKDDLEYIKSQILNISLLYLDEIEKVTKINNELSDRLTNMEKTLGNIEKELFIPNDFDFEIICPYCNAEFIENFTDETKSEVKCPECGNTIELDWNEEEGCSCGCDDCEDDCDECMHEDDDIEENEDDM